MNFIFIHTHPIQYFSPLYQYLTAQGMQLEVWYCAAANNSIGYDKEFGTQITWDIPLLEGYAYRMFHNDASEKAIQRKSFGAYKNREMLKALQDTPPSMVVVHGWNYSTYVSLLRHAKKAGHQLAFRGETNHAMEMAKPFWKRWLRKPLLSWLLQEVDYFLYIGTQSKKFYQHLGVAYHQFIHTPYAVDNARFQQAAKNIDSKTLRSSMSIPDAAFVLLYSGKYISKKRPLDVLKAFASMHTENSYLIMMGDGALRSDMEQFMSEHQLQKKVLLTGFINQQKVSQYYAIANAFVMCSDYGETWGLSVNEAMNFSLPLVVSDRCGCAADLVEPGINGYIFQTGNIAQLTSYLQQLQQMPADTLKQMGQASLQKVETHSYRVIHERLLQLHT